MLVQSITYKKKTLQFWVLIKKFGFYSKGKVNTLKQSK